MLRRRRDAGGRRPVHPLPAPRHRPAVRQLRPRLDVLVPQPGQPDRQLRALARVHPGPRRRLGGQVLAHDSMLHPLPDAVPDRGASLYEPVSIACHGLMRAMPDDGEPVLVVGAGIIGLASLAALRGLFPDCPVTVLARHPHQASGGRGLRGRPRRHGDPRQRPLGGAGGTERRPGRRPQAPRHADGRLPLRRRGGGIAGVGHRGAAGRRAPGHRPPARRGRISEVDLTPIWYKEAALVGSIDHTVDARLGARAGRRAGPPLGRPRPRRPRGRPAPGRGRGHPRVRARRLPRGRRDGDRPRHVPRHQGRLPALRGGGATGREVECGPLGPGRYRRVTRWSVHSISFSSIEVRRR